MPRAYPERWHRYFTQELLPFEGGYKPPEPPDRVTIAGFTDHSMVKYARDVPADVVAAMTPDFRSRFQAIIDAPTKSDAYARANELMLYTKQFLKPNGMGGTTHHIIGNKAGVESLFEGIFHMYYKRFVVEPGFDQVPDPVGGMQATLVDVGVRMGPARAWALYAKAATESDLITRAQFNTYPVISSADLNNKGMFAKGGKGAAYHGDALHTRLIADVKANNASDCAHALAIQRLNVWAQLYDNALITESPKAFARYEDGWRDRKDFGMPQVGDTRCLKDTAMMAYVQYGQEQTSLFHSLLSSVGLSPASNRKEVVVDIPGAGPFVFTVRETKGMARNEDGKWVPSNIHVLDEVIAKHGAFRMLRTGESLTFTYDGKTETIYNPYRDSTMLVWRDSDYMGPRGEPQKLVISPEFIRHAMALKDSGAPGLDTVEYPFRNNRTGEVQVHNRLDPLHSATVIVPDNPHQALTWVDPKGDVESPRTPTSVAAVDPARAMQGQGGANNSASRR